MTLRGKVEQVARDRIRGWAWDPDVPEQHVELIVSVNGADVGKIVANSYRDDLEKQAVGDGRFGFVWPLKPALALHQPHVIKIRRASDGVHLRGSPWLLKPIDPKLPRKTLFKGRLDRVTGSRVQGWAWDEAAPQAPVALLVFADGQPLGRIVADRHRPDLELNAVRGGRASFELELSSPLDPLTHHIVEVRREGDGLHVNGSPWLLDATQAPAKAAVTLVGKTELVTHYRIKGWVADPAHPRTPVSVIVSANGDMIGRVLANQQRRDVALRVHNEGRCGFELHAQPPLSIATRYTIELRRENDGVHLDGSPYVLESSAAFDKGAQAFMTQILSSAESERDIEQRLVFLANQARLLRQMHAERFSGAQNAKTKRRLAWQEPAVGASAAAPTDEKSKPRALVIDKVAPTSNHDAGSNAILSHMRSLQRLGYDVTFAPLSLRAETDLLDAEGVLCCRRPWYETIEEVLLRHRNAFSVVYLHRVEAAGPYTALARLYQAKARIIYSVADLQFLRLARQADVEQRPELRIESQRTRRVELNAAASADAVITHSSFEADILGRSVAAAKVHTVPWAAPARPVTTPFAQRSGLAFVGGYGHKPNVDAALWLVEAVMPELGKLDPAIGCLIVGSDMPETLRRLAGGVIEAVGQVPDLSDAFERIRLTVAPLAYGAGVKGKVLDSLAAGVPCICSPAAAEGMDLPKILQDQVVSAPADFARKIKALHDDADLNAACAEAGLAYVNAIASDANVDALMRKVLSSYD